MDENEDENEEWDDERMFLVDEAIAAHLRQNKQAKTSRKDQQSQELHFKLRLLDLMETFVKRECEQPLVLEAVPMLLEVRRNLGRAGVCPFFCLCPAVFSTAFWGAVSQTFSTASRVGPPGLNLATRVRGVLKNRFEERGLKILLQKMLLSLLNWRGVIADHGAPIFGLVHYRMFSSRTIPSLDDEQVVRCHELLRDAVELTVNTHNEEVRNWVP